MQKKEHDQRLHKVQMQGFFKKYRNENIFFHLLAEYGCLLLPQYGPDRPCCLVLHVLGRRGRGRGGGSLAGPAAEGGTAKARGALGKKIVGSRRLFTSSKGTKKYFDPANLKCHKLHFFLNSKLIILPTCSIPLCTSPPPPPSADPPPSSSS